MRPIASRLARPSPMTARRPRIKKPARTTCAAAPSSCARGGELRASTIWSRKGLVGFCLSPVCLGLWPGPGRRQSPTPSIRGGGNPPPPVPPLLSPSVSPRGEGGPTRPPGAGSSGPDPRCIPKGIPPEMEAISRIRPPRPQRHAPPAKMGQPTAEDPPPSASTATFGASP